MTIFILFILVAAVGVAWLFWRAKTTSAGFRTDDASALELDAPRARPRFEPVRRTEKPCPIQPLPPAVKVTISSARSDADTVPVHSTSRDEIYQCDLVALTCTCGDFFVRRSGFAQIDPWRLCKHLRGALFEAGRVTLEDTGALQLYLERGGQIFRWVAPDGRPVFLSVDPTRDWIDIARVLNRETGKTSYFGWSTTEERWAYGSFARGITPDLKLLFETLAQFRDAQLRALDPSVLHTSERNAAIQLERDKQKAAATEAAGKAAHEAGRAVGLCCGVCSAPLGLPWGTVVGTDVNCSNCGFSNIIKGEEIADATERALIDWKYYGDPRPGGQPGLMTIEKEKRKTDLEAIRLRGEAQPSPDAVLLREPDRIESEFYERFNALHARRQEELANVRQRIRSVQGKLKRRVVRAAKAPRT